MKKIITLSGVLLLAAASLAFAGGLEELRAAAGVAAQAAASAGLPAPSRAGYPAVESYGAASITVTAPGGVRASVGAVYAARKDSHFCTEFSWNEGSMARVPKQVYRKFEAQNGRITVPGAIDGGCDYARAGEGSLSFSIPGRAEAYNSLPVMRGGSAGAEQGVVCEIIRADGPESYSGEKLNCRGDVRLDAAGRALVSVTIEGAANAKAPEGSAAYDDSQDISRDKLVQFGSVCEMGQNQADAVSRASLLLNEPFVRLRTNVNVWTSAGTFSGTYVRAPYRIVGEATVSKISVMARYNWLACIPVQGSQR
jgi:hypothetical protein